MEAWRRLRRAGLAAALLLGVLACLGLATAGSGGNPTLVTDSASPFPYPPGVDQWRLLSQTTEQASLKSQGCVHCHQNTGDPHVRQTLHLGCIDCHGGNPASVEKNAAHIAPRFPDAWPPSAKPVRSYTLLNHESPEFVRFMNPGDLRVAHISCGTMGCHANEVLQNRMSMMTHGCMLWGAALYNNGAVPSKRPVFGESYSMHGNPLRLQTVPPPTDHEMEKKGVLAMLDPFPRYEISQPGNILRVFERGGRFRNEVGIPERLEESGRPRTRLSTRGLGTQNRTDPTVLGAQKTRLFDPTLNFLGTNDHPGDYRSSGCTACHVIYANDRSPIHSGPYAYAGNMGRSSSLDPTIPKNESGHPIEHRFTTAIPTSQCIVCHVHPGTSVLNGYLGYMWWDEETDGEFFYPTDEKHTTAEQFVQSLLSNPDEAAARGLWSDPEFLDRSSDLNSSLRHTQLADFHGHGWLFRAVFKHDREGNYLDYAGRRLDNVGTAELQAALAPPTPSEQLAGRKRAGIPVHYMDIHLEKGMHCIDCHFLQDVHGNTKLYGELRAAIEIQCTDCHGTVSKRATLSTSGPAAPSEGHRLEALITPFGQKRFERHGDRIIQRSMVEKDQSWEVVQTVDSIDPKSSHYSEKARLAKTVRFDSEGKMAWGDVPANAETVCAHANEKMSCIACHSSWNQSCYGCHLPQRADIKTPQLHNEGDVTRNLVSYNFQTLRDDVYMLAKDGDVTANRIGPARSSCAIHVGSYNQNRESIYVQQQTISADGLSGISFSTNVPHTVRAGAADRVNGRPIHHEAFLAGRSETKSCTDCHVSAKNDNNAIMAQLLMQGTNYVNLIGRYAWVAAGEHGLTAVAVTERPEPQAVIGSTLHRLAFPEEFQRHLANGRILKVAHEHPGKDIGDSLLHPLRKNEVRSVQARGEYLYAACGEGGLRVFDIAFIDDKAFSERFTTAPVSPLGQQFYVPTRDCTDVASPTTLAPDPTRKQDPANREQPIHPLYGNIYVTDRCEGLIVVGVATTINGNPLDNFLHRELTFNPDNILKGARFITIAGVFAYIGCDAGIVVVSLDDPRYPQVVTVLGPEIVDHPRSMAVQFRYGFVCDADGLKILDVTDPKAPRPAGRLAIPSAHSVYVARTYAYVAAGPHGLVIVNVENPEKPFIDQVYDAGGCINDLRDVKLGITYVSEFAYLADGKNGMRIVQLTSPETPGNYGFSPRPIPQLIATYPMPSGAKAIGISKGLDRDRAVDESGNQIAVFGRIGARPLNLEEQRRLYWRNGAVWRVSDDPVDPMYGPPRGP